MRTQFENMQYQVVTVRGYALFLLSLCILFSLGGCGVESSPETGELEEAAQLLIHGKVTSGNGPLGAVSVICLQTGDATESAADGSYSLQVPADQSLQLLLENGAFSVVTESLDLTGRGEGTQIDLLLSADRASVKASIIPSNNNSADESPADGDSEPEPDPAADAPYDSAGNTSLFGIPSSLIGNAHRGKKEYIARCASCHSDLVGTNRDFSGLKRDIAASPMFITMPDSRLADIVAYLHFRGR